jgi:hypothetical protein
VQTTFHTLGLNSFAAVPEGAPLTPHSSFEVELDVARVTWVASDTALVTAKTGMLLLLTLGHDGRSASCFIRFLYQERGGVEIERQTL